MIRLGQAQSRALAALLFERMLAAAGPRHWWPVSHNGAGAARDEIVIGAILTQNTSWKNVEQALAELAGAGLLSLARLARAPVEKVAPLIRPARYFNLKARRLRAAAEFFAPAGCERFAALAQWDDARLREAVLGIWGVGPETADSILLYALERPSFVIDAYTLRIGCRHGFFDEAATYDQARAWFMRHAPAGVPHYNEYHALLVWIGHHYCKPRPDCAHCPLAGRECFASARAWRALADYRLA
jgi:endonuclease-3 related protein